MDAAAAARAAALQSAAARAEGIAGGLRRASDLRAVSRTALLQQQQQQQQQQHQTSDESARAALNTATAALEALQTVQVIRLATPKQHGSWRCCCCIDARALHLSQVQAVRSVKAAPAPC
jgi:hypothetical protein